MNCTKYYTTLQYEIIDPLKNNPLPEEESILNLPLNLKIQDYLTKRIKDWGNISDKAHCQVNNRFFQFTYQVDRLHIALAQKITKSNTDTVFF